jgi:hypothetical protein
MTCADSIFVGDEGTVFQVEISECISGATSIVAVGTATAIEFRFLPPSKLPLKVRTGVVSTPSVGADGLVEYTTLAGDISTAGTWKLQVRVRFPNGVWRTTVATFVVLAPIEPVHYFDPLSAGVSVSGVAVSLT